MLLMVKPLDQKQLTIVIKWYFDYILLANEICEFNQTDQGPVSQNS